MQATHTHISKDKSMKMIDVEIYDNAVKVEVKDSMNGNTLLKDVIYYDIQYKQNMIYYIQNWSDENERTQNAPFISVFIVHENYPQLV